jgi:hypothetical protein
MFVLLEWQIPVETFLPLIFRQLHQKGVEGRMKVEDGGKRGVTQPFWLRMVVQHGFSFSVSWRSIPKDTTDASNRQRFHNK